MNHAKIRTRRHSFNQWRIERNLDPLPEITTTFVDHIKPITLLALNTGLRLGEIFNLKWSSINWVSNFLTVEGGGSKSGQTRHVPLTDEAHQILKEWRKQNTKSLLVFPSPVTGKRLDNINSAWVSIRKDADLYHPKDADINFRFHDLRHTFASNLVMQGVDLNVVRELLGHESMDMTLRYAHLAPQSKAKAIEVLNQRMKGKQIDSDTAQPANPQMCQPYREADTPYSFNPQPSAANSAA